MATHGSPGSTRIAKNTMLIAPSSMGIAIRTRRATYWSMGLLEHFEELGIVVAVVQRELAVLGVERRAHALGIARPLPRHVADGQADQVLLDTLLGLVVDRRALLHVALDAPGRQQVVDPAIVREVRAVVAGRRIRDLLGVEEQREPGIGVGDARAAVQHERRSEEHTSELQSR